jgi:hypothetical protein
MGWLDIFSPEHTLSGDFPLMQGESANIEVYLMSKGQSVSVAGPLHQLGWNEQYIIFTDANWPKPWNVIRVKDHAKFIITDAQRTTDPGFKEFQLCHRQMLGTATHANLWLVSTVAPEIRYR